MEPSQSLVLTDTHIDVARNATDDFNLFHDKLRWSEIRNNPFKGPIALGFQLIGLIDATFKDYRKTHDETSLIESHQLHYSYYQLKFANVVAPGQAIALSIKKSQFKESTAPQLSNRFSLSADNQLALIGYKRELAAPNIFPNFSLDGLTNIHQLTDRSFINGTPYFVKHKYFNTSNGKNFLVGSLVEQSQFFDELNNKYIFPESFPLSLASCALLERAKLLKHDFKQNPMVYVSHQHCTDTRLMKKVKSNMQLTLLVSQEKDGDSGIEKAYCFGIINENEVLFRSELCLAPLSHIIKP